MGHPSGRVRINLTCRTARQRTAPRTLERPQIRIGVRPGEKWAGKEQPNRRGEGRKHPEHFSGKRSPGSQNLARRRPRRIGPVEIRYRRRNVLRIRRAGRERRSGLRVRGAGQGGERIRRIRNCRLRPHASNHSITESCGKQISAKQIANKTPRRAT